MREALTFLLAAYSAYFAVVFSFDGRWFHAGACALCTAVMARLAWEDMRGV